MVSYLTSNLWLIWVIVCVVCLILEVSSGTFYILCFAIGALFSVLFSLFGVPFWVQVIVFAVFTVASIYWVRPFVMKYLHRDEDNKVSNSAALIGRTGVVIEEIKAAGHGYVKIDGDEWRAVAQSDLPIPKGTKVRIVSMESIVVTVVKV